MIILNVPESLKNLIYESEIRVTHSQAIEMMYGKTLGSRSPDVLDRSPRKSGSALSGRS